MIQIVSKVPIENLKTGDVYLSRAMDRKNIPAEARKQGFTVPMDAMLEAADFDFIVEDRNGVRSNPARLVIAYAEDLYKGPFVPLQDKPEGAGADPK